MIMRMIIATGSPVERFLALLLEHPERFVRSQVPCCLQGLWEEALEGRSCQLPGDHRPDTSKSPPTIHRLGGSCVN